MESYTPYHKGAVAGKMLGLHLCAILAFVVISLRVPETSLVCLALIAAVPMNIYVGMRRTLLQHKDRVSVSALWVQGIMATMFGALICSFATVVYIHWFDPAFIYDYAQRAIVQCSAQNSDWHRSVAKALTYIVDHNGLPDTTDFVLSMFWLTTAFGCIVSLPMAVLAKTAKRRNAVAHSLNKN